MSATRIGRSLMAAAAAAVLFAFPATAVQADDLFSRDGFSRIIGTPAVPVPPGGTVPGAPSVPGGRSLQPAELSDFLKSSGLQPEERGPGVCLVQMVRDKWTIPTVVLVDADANTVAIVAVLVTLENYGDLPAAKMLEMLQMQGELGKRSNHFFSIAKDKPRIAMCCAMENRDLEATRFRSEIEDVITSAVKTEAVWNKDRWGETPGSSRPQVPQVPQAPQIAQVPQAPVAPQVVPVLPQVPQIPSMQQVPQPPVQPNLPGPQQPSQLPYWLRPISQQRPNGPGGPVPPPTKYVPPAQVPVPVQTIPPYRPPVAQPTPQPQTRPQIPATGQIVGRWLGTVNSTEAFGLAFQADGSFVLVHSKGDTTNKNSGRYTFDGRTLRLDPVSGNPIVAVCTWTATDKFRFRLASEPESEQGIVFERME